RLRMREDEIPGEDLEELEAAVQNGVDDEVDAAPPGDLEGLLVARVALQDEVRRGGRVEDLRGVDPLDRLAADERGADRLPAPGGARHEVALDERRRDLHVGLVERPVDVDL